MTTLTPLYDRILIKRSSPETQTSGGIIIPETAKEKPQQAEVIAVGAGRPGKNNEIRPLTVKAGNRILFGKYAGDEIKINGEELLILRESDVLAIIEN